LQKLEERWQKEKNRWQRRSRDEKIKKKVDEKNCANLEHTNTGDD
jgi:hypothetical protein